MESNTPTERLVASSNPDLVWRVKVSGMLADLTQQVLALTEVVMVMNQKLAEREERERGL